MINKPINKPNFNKKWAARVLLNRGMYEMARDELQDVSDYDLIFQSHFEAVTPGLLKEVADEAMEYNNKIALEHDYVPVDEVDNLIAMQLTLLGFKSCCVLYDPTDQEAKTTMEQIKFHLNDLEPNPDIIADNIAEADRIYLMGIQQANPDAMILGF